jgi:hypothetical protein
MENCMAEGHELYIAIAIPSRLCPKLDEISACFSCSVFSACKGLKDRSKLGSGITSRRALLSAPTPSD